MQTLTVQLKTGQTANLARLLDRGAESNAKLAKSNKSKLYRTYGLSLAPALSSGFQTCAHSSAGCRAGCIFETGLASVYGLINRQRVAKTIAYFTQRAWFLDKLCSELRNAQAHASANNWQACVRLNVFSDISWERVCPQLFDDCQDVQFYDYTKNAKRMLRFCAGNFPANYNLTFSRSENNWNDCQEVLSAGGNVTVVFRSKQLPKRFGGFRVVPGDENDMRFLDARPRIVGLYAKGTVAKHDKTGFVVD